MPQEALRSSKPDRATCKELETPKLRLGTRGNIEPTTNVSSLLLYLHVIVHISCQKTLPSNLATSGTKFDPGCLFHRISQDYTTLGTKALL